MTDKTNDVGTRLKNWTKAISEASQDLSSPLAPSGRDVVRQFAEDVLERR